MGQQATIRRLTQQWLAAVNPSVGGFSLGGVSEGYRLRNNGIVPHCLSVDELQVAIVSLAEVLLLPGFNAILDLDHYLAWAWTSDLLIRHEQDVRSRRGFVDLGDLLGATVDLALAPLEPNVGVNLMTSSPTAWVMTAFPLLEGSMRRVCRRYVRPDGTVRRSFTGLTGTRYGPPGQPGQRRCNRVHDLLHLYFAQVAPVRARRNLTVVRAHLAQLGPSGADPFALVDSWRNEHLHGEAQKQTIGGAIMSLSLLVLLHDASRELTAALPDLRQRQQRELDWSRTSSAGFRMTRFRYLPVFGRL